MKSFACLCAVLAIGTAAAPERPANVPISSIPAPNYMDDIKARAIWPSFPLRVYFARDKSYSDEREMEARHGFSTWVDSTAGVVSFVVTDNPKEAQVTVRFDPGSNDGFTTTRFHRFRIASARIAVGVRRNWKSDIECIAAHEFGHALGLDGHSDRQEDLMFPMHLMGAPWSVSRRDLNTLAALYRVTEWKGDGQVASAEQHVPKK